MSTSVDTTFQLDNPVYGTADELTAAEERLEGEYEYAEVNVRPAGTSLPLVMSTSEKTTFQLDNPVYGTADELTAAEERLAAATPEHNLVNPLYGSIDTSDSHAQGQAEDPATHEYAALETLYNATVQHY